MLDWTVVLFFKPDVTKVELPSERNGSREDSARTIVSAPSAIEGAETSIIPTSDLSDT
jgi:hypothetical protein